MTSSGPRRRAIRAPRFMAGCVYWRSVGLLRKNQQRGSGVFVGDHALELLETLLDLQEFADDDDVRLLGVDPDGAGGVGDQ